MKILSIICLITGLIIGAIWLTQEFTTLSVLDNPATGAGIFLLLGFLLNVLSKKKTG